MRFQLAVILILSASFMTFAQPPDMLWSQTYGGVYEEWCQAMQQTTDGGYVLAGHSYSFGTGMEDFWVVKTDAVGNTTWAKRYGGNAAERAWAIQQTSDGGYIVAGFTQSFGAGAKDFWLLKLNDNGDSLWSRTFGGSLNEWATCVRQTSDGGYVLAGWTQSYGAGNLDMWVVKTNSTGQLTWSHTYGGSGQDECHDIQELPGGGYLVSGFTHSFGAGDFDFYLIKTSANGTQLWAHTYGGGGSDQSWAATLMSDGGFAVVGQTMSHGSGAKDFWLVRTDADGNLLWHRPFGGVLNEWATAVRETSDGGILLGGWTQSYGAGNLDMWIVKTFPNGDLYWNRTFGGNGSDECHALQETADGGYAFAGFSSSFGGGYNYWLIKAEPDQPLAVELLTFDAIPEENAIRLEFVTASELNNDHFEIWRATNTDGPFAQITEIASQGNSPNGHEYAYVDSDVASGVTYWYYLASVDIAGNRTEYRDRTVSASPLNVPPPDGLIPDAYSLGAYPNPFNPTTTIELSVPAGGRATLRVYDITGKQVMELADRAFEAGTHQLAFNAANLPAGIYFLRFSTNALTLAQKLVLLK